MKKMMNGCDGQNVLEKDGDSPIEALVVSMHKKLATTARKLTGRR